MSKIIKAQIRTLEAISSAMVVINKGIDKDQRVLNTGIDKAQALVVNALNNRIDRLANELLFAASLEAERPYMEAEDYDYELERLAYRYETMKAEIERKRNQALNKESLYVAGWKSKAYLDERKALLARKK